MFRLRFRTDSTARTKKGHPPQRTTGVARASSSQTIQVDPAWPILGRNSRMAIATSGTDKTVQTQNRRRMPESSGFSSSSPVAVRGSSAIPQIGQFPGASRMICGCIGQVHSVCSEAPPNVGRPEDRCPGLRQSSLWRHFFAPVRKVSVVKWLSQSRPGFADRSMCVARSNQHAAVESEGGASVCVGLLDRALFRGRGDEADREIGQGPAVFLEEPDGQDIADAQSRGVLLGMSSRAIPTGCAHERSSLGSPTRTNVFACFV